MRFTNVALAYLAAITAVASPIPPHKAREAQLCNANADLCSRQYSNISFVGTHNSAFYGPLDDPRLNQVLSLTEQLDAGVRFLQAQTHKNVVGEISMCHTDCILYDGGSLASYLTDLKTWLDAHEDAVVSLLLTNGDSIEDMTEFSNIMKSVGIDGYAFVPSTTPDQIAKSDWPTLGEMVTSGKRLVIFMDYWANTKTVPYILPEFEYFFETPFDTTDPTFNQCSINRPPNAEPEGLMILVNHFLDKEVLWMDDVLVPDTGANFQTNAAKGEGSIGAQVGLCEKTYGRTPNVVLLDHFNRGNWLVAQQNMNFPGQ